MTVMIQIMLTTARDDDDEADHGDGDDANHDDGFL